MYQTSAPAADCRESNINNEIQLRETVPIITCAPLLIQEAGSIKSLLSFSSAVMKVREEKRCSRI